MSALRFVGLNPGTINAQRLADAANDVLLVSQLGPSGAVSSLVVTPTSAATTNLLVINDSSGFPKLTLDNTGYLTVSGAALVGAGTSTVAGPIDFNGNVTLGNDTVDTVTFARGWTNVGVDTSYSESLTLTPTAPANANGYTAGAVSSSVMVVTGASPAINAGVPAPVGSLALHTSGGGVGLQTGTAWIKTGSGATSWTQLAAAGGASLQTAYVAGPGITTDNTNNAVTITSGAGNTTGALVVTGDSAGGTALSVTQPGLAGTALTLTAAAGSSLINAVGAADAALTLGSFASGYSLSVGTSTNANGAGGNLGVVAGTGLDAVGGALTLSSGTSSGATGGTGGATSISGGAGFGANQAGGAVSITGGAGLGTGSGGAITLLSGATGTGTAGQVLIDVASLAPIGIGTVNPATTSIGTAANGSVVVGTAGALSTALVTINHSAVGLPGDDVVALNSGSTIALTTSVGAYAIGVGAGDITGVIATNLQDALVQLGTAASTAGAHTLQKAYDGSAAVTIADSTPITLTHAAGPGGVFSIADAGTSGTSFLLNNTGTNAILDIQDAGTSVLAIDAAGAVSVNPTAGQNVSLTTLTTGAITLTSASTTGITSAGSTTLSSTGAAASVAISSTLSDITFSASGSAALAFNQATDLVLDSALFPSTVTSIVGALNDLASSDSSVIYSTGVALIEVGSVMTVDAAAHSAKHAVLASGSQAILGVALTGNVASTVRVANSGEVLSVNAGTISGTPVIGDPVYLGVTSGVGQNLVLAAPTTAGDLLLRVGWVTDATGPYKIAIDFSDGVVI